jgi:hypothetical protein
MEREFIRRAVCLEEDDYQIVLEAAKMKGLTYRGFSSALRQIIREWHTLTQNQPAVLMINVKAKEK